MIDDFKNLCSDKIDLFIKKVLPLSYIINGISLSEGFAFCMMCEYFKMKLKKEKVRKIVRGN